MLPTQRVAFLPEMGNDVTNLAMELASPALDLIPICSTAPEEEVIKLLGQVQFVVGFLLPLTPAMIRAMSHVRLIQLLTAGYDHFNIQDVLQEGIPVAHVGGANARSVAEHTLLLVLAVLKKLVPLHESVMSGEWRQDTPNVLEFQELSQKVVGILGMGRVGREVARLLQGFETLSFYYDLYGPSSDVESSLGVRFLDLDKLLERVDVLTIHLPLNQTTRHLLNADRLNRLRPGAILINTGRGGVVDYAALVRGLSEGRLAGAGLDVFPDEPLSAQHPLLGFRDRVVLTPHRAGATEQSWFRRLRNAFLNIERVCLGLPALWTVDFLLHRDPSAE